MSKLKQAYLALFHLIRKEHGFEDSLMNLMKPDQTWEALNIEEKRIPYLLQQVAESVHAVKSTDYHPYSKKIALSLMYLINQKIH